jgi:pimeloyl-ACP methyl ester carboxylesterase
MADDRIKLHGFLVQRSLNHIQDDGSETSFPKQPSSCLWIIVHGVNGNFYGSTLLTDLARTALLANHDALLVNTRGHDLATFGSAEFPARLGAMYESLSDAHRDLQAWTSFAHSLNYSQVGIIAYSLGAVKTTYVAAHHYLNVNRIVALSPPRLNTDLLLTDPEKQKIFKKHLELASHWCEQGEPHHIIRVRFPMANWVSASTYMDRYGNGNKYDYLVWATSIQIPTLWMFGEIEVSKGSVNFKHANQALEEQFQATFGEDSKRLHQTMVIPGADHSYNDSRKALSQSLRSWLTDLECS